MKALGQYINGQIYIDHDYRDQLNESENQWLKQFDSEYYLGYNLNDPNVIHAEEYHKELYRGVNERRRDLLNQKNVVLLSPEELAGEEKKGERD